MREDAKLNSQVHAINNFRALCPEVDKDLGKFEEAKEQLVEKLYDYFQIVFVENDLERAVAEKDRFVAEIMKGYKKTRQSFFDLLRKPYIEGLIK